VLLREALLIPTCAPQIRIEQDAIEDLDRLVSVRPINIHAGWHRSHLENKQDSGYRS
jgi:hypothetical protein